MLNSIILGINDFFKDIRKNILLISLLSVFLFLVTFLLIVLTNQKDEKKNINTFVNSGYHLVEVARKNLDTSYSEDLLSKLQTFYKDGSYTYTNGLDIIEEEDMTIFTIFGTPYNDIEGREEGVAYMKNNQTGIESLEMYNKTYLIEELEDQLYNFDINDISGYIQSDTVLFIFASDNFSDYMNVNDTHEMLTFVGNSKLLLNENELSDYVDIIDESFIQLIVKDPFDSKTIKSLNFTNEYMLVLMFLIFVAIILVMQQLISGHIEIKAKEYTIHMLYGATRFMCLVRSGIENIILITVSLTLVLMYDKHINGSSLVRFLSRTPFFIISSVAILMYILYFNYKLKSSKLLENLRGEGL